MHGSGDAAIGVFMANFKERLKRRIVGILGETASGRTHTRPSLEGIADDVLGLFQERVDAPASRKRGVWAEGEEKILRKLRRHELTRAKHAAAESAKSSHSKSA
jgi:hypothetical protein